MSSRVAFEIRDRAAWRRIDEPVEDVPLFTVTDTKAPVEVPRRRPSSRVRHRRVQGALAAAALFLLLLALLAGPVEATVRTPGMVEEDFVYRGPVGDAARTVLRVEVIETGGSGLSVAEGDGVVTIIMSPTRDLGLRLRFHGFYDDVAAWRLPDGSYGEVWERSTPRSLVHGVSAGVIPLERGVYLLDVWSGSPRSEAHVAVDVVTLQDETVFDDGVFFKKVSYVALALCTGAAALVVRYRARLGRAGGDLIEGASSLWDRLRERVGDRGLR
ncbi:MAG: hypothetical protein KY455_12600 [Euryarchaeota archaeon]|nr:hypothetical protein [Euryarchaeota archaeon]